MLTSVCAAVALSAGNIFLCGRQPLGLYRFVVYRNDNSRNPDPAAGSGGVVVARSAGQAYPFIPGNWRHSPMRCVKSESNSRREHAKCFLWREDIDSLPTRVQRQYCGGGEVVAHMDGVVP